MVIFYTMAYNAERTLPRTIQSVLDQTEPNWMWYLLDNGSQDSTGKIIHEYAAADTRIVPLRNERNMAFTPDTSFFDLARRHDDADWFCFLDADDIYYADFAEQMLAFAAKYDLDMAACGSEFVDAKTEMIGERRILTRDLILSKPEEFDGFFSTYHPFMRTNWGKFFSIRILKRIDMSRVVPLFYGTDTLYTQEAIRNAKRFGILAKILHRYYVYPKSRSYQWDPHRFESDKILYQSAYSFLTDKCGSVSTRSRQFLQLVYSHAVENTVDVIRSSALSAADKLRECRVIADDPLTYAAYRECKDKSAGQSKKALLCCVLQAGAELKDQEGQDLRAVVQCLAPHCVQAVSAANAKLFLEDPGLMQALLQDDAEALLRDLLTRIGKNQFVKKYPLPETVQALAADKPLLCQIGDAVFLRKYARIYLMVWRGETLDALEEMTGMLLEDRVSGGQETFLQLYISLSAVLEQEPAFVYGKLRLAQMYFQQKRLSECRAVVAELEEMGLADNEELEALRHDLERNGE